jgi:SecD/SecF fusion protein
MFHDVLILLGIFAWLGKPVDGVFLAALLTVVGYSVNDSVVVFDRIRERLRVRGARLQPMVELANEACLQTIPRTINTGLGAMFILAALLLLGGDSLSDFALALLVGILVGTWSSIFTAAPLAVAFERSTAGRTGPTAPDPIGRARAGRAPAEAVDMPSPRALAEPASGSRGRPRTRTTARRSRARRRRR